MTNLNEAVIPDWNDEMGSPNRAVGGGGIVNWLTTAIHRLRDILDEDVDADLDQLKKIEDEDGDYFPACDCSWV